MKMLKKEIIVYLTEQGKTLKKDFSKLTKLVKKRSKTYKAYRQAEENTSNFYWHRNGQKKAETVHEDHEWGATYEKLIFIENEKGFIFRADDINAENYAKYICQKIADILHPYWWEISQKQGDKTASEVLTKLCGSHRIYISFNGGQILKDKNHQDNSGYIKISLYAGECSAVVGSYNKYYSNKESAIFREAQPVQLSSVKQYKKAIAKIEKEKREIEGKIDKLNTYINGLYLRKYIKNIRKIEK